jgi:hypothetical protein
MALAVPLVPLTDAGGKGWPLSLPAPQQTTFPVPAWIAQLWPAPAAMALVVPIVAVTAGDGAWPALLSPQQTTLSVPAWIAQLW